MHYQRWRRYGDPFSVSEIHGSVEERFAAYVDPQESGCWNWTGELGPGGYGRLQVDGRRVAAHRWSYEHHVGPIPEGLVVDHLCGNRGCVNPEHLEPVTQRENLMRAPTLQAANAAKTHCKHGHLLSPDNVERTANGNRQCRTCRRRRAREYQRRRRARLNADRAAA